MAVWVARQIGVSKSLMSRIVSGEATISETNGKLIAALLGCDFFVLFDLQNGEDVAPNGTIEEPCEAA